MEKLFSKKDTKIVIEEFLKILKEIEISREEIANLEIFGDSVMDIEVLPNTVNRLHENIRELICDKEDEKNIDIIENLIVGYCSGKIDYEEIWGFFIKIMCNEIFTEEQLKLLDRIRVF